MHCACANYFGTTSIALLYKFRNAFVTALSAISSYVSSVISSSSNSVIRCLNNFIFESRTFLLRPRYVASPEDLAHISGH